MNGRISFLAFLILILLFSGCSLPNVSITIGDPPTPIPAQPTAAVTVELTGLIPLSEVQTEAATEEVVTAEPTPTAEPEMTPTVAHLTSPVEPQGKYQTIHDQVSDKYAAQNRAYSGDDFKIGRYERSFTGNMKYLPFIDIQKAELNRQDFLWVFVRLELIGNPKSGEEADPYYGVELDVDANNRGDYLVWVRPPEGTQWTTEGVQVWQDMNIDVGGLEAVKSDNSRTSDGYENLIFDQGQGDDPDLAWVRLSPQGANFIEMAFKNSLTGGEKGKFIWLPWAALAGQEPGFFEFNDRFTFQEAGSPLLEMGDFYPLKALWGLDNTCRGTSGMPPQPSMIGACPNYEPPPSRPENPGPGGGGPSPVPPWEPPILY